jgi:hypothetical protein
MRLIDNKWIDLSLGFQAVQALQSRLESEFDRAVEVGHKQKYQRELTEWQKKRRVFFALLALAPLPVIALCITAYYFREVACVLAWWLVTVLAVFVTLIAAGWSYIQQMINGQPVPQRAHVAASLAEQWWDSISPKTLSTKTHSDHGEVDFLTILSRSLSDEWLGVYKMFPPDPDLPQSDILLVGSSGIWLFKVIYWSGRIIKQDGIWKQVHKKQGETIFDKAPDEQWTLQRDEILRSVQLRMPHLALTADMLQGGLVFPHPKVVLDKTRIQGNAAPYGLPRAWVERVRQSSPDDRFPLEVRLEVLDALAASINYPKPQPVEYTSSKDEANRIYEGVASQLREYVAEMVK